MGAVRVMQEEKFLLIPYSVTFGQWCVVVGKYLDDHPEKWNSGAEVLVLSAMGEVWPGTPPVAGRARGTAVNRLPALRSFIVAVGVYGQDVGFSPGGTALAVVEKAISAAKSEVLMACYEFTSRDVAEALEAAAHRGVKVRIVADWKAAQDRFSQVPVLQAAGIPVGLDRLYAIMHNKFLVIDGDSVETGSFNYTVAADKHNGENALVLWDVPEIAGQYAAEWGRLWAESQ